MKPLLQGMPKSFPGSPVLGLIAAFAAAPAILIGGAHGAVLWAICVGCFAALLVDVPLPGGGSVPLGSALIVSAMALLPARQGILVAVAAVMMLVASSPSWPSWSTWRLGWLALTTPSSLELPSGIRLAAVATRTGLSIGAAASVRLALGLGAPSLLTRRGDSVVLGVLAIGGAYYLVDWALIRRNQDVRRPADRLSVQLALLCASALIVVGFRVDGAAGSVIAGIPLVVTRFSFRRHAAARQTYEQTAVALGTLPEVAGFASLGHAERTAGFADLLAARLGLDPKTSADVRTAARLHHIGEVSMHHPDANAGFATPDELGAVSTEILKDTGFLADVAPLVEEILTAPIETVGLPAAVVRVASTMDDLASRFPAVWGAAVPAAVMAELISMHPSGAEARAASELVSLCVARPDAVAEIAARRPLSAPELDGADHDHASS